MKYFFYLSVFLLHVPFAFSSRSTDHQSDHKKVADQVTEQTANSKSKSDPSAHQEKVTHQASEDIVVAEVVAVDGATAKVVAKGSVRVKNSICFLYGKGFEPNENLKVASTSSDEVLPFKIQADSKGEFFAGLAPEVIGKSGGVCHVNIIREFVDAPLHLRYPWGSDAIFTHQSD